MKSAIIGGTGIDSSFPIDMMQRVVQTPYGAVELFEGSGENSDLVFLPRHSVGHSLPPHLINYRANISALKQLGVGQTIGMYAVGSITGLLSPGSWGLVDQFIDMTGGGREHTFFTGGDAGVKHVAMVQPYSLPLRKAIARSALEHGNRDIVVKGTYVCTNGPRLETPAEIRMFRILGGDYVGMTAATETILAAEAGIPFAAIAFSINWAAGLDEEGVSFLEDETIERITRDIVAVCVPALRHPVHP